MLGMGCVILLWHSLSLSYIYFAHYKALRPRSRSWTEMRSPGVVVYSNETIKFAQSFPQILTLCWVFQRQKNEAIPKRRQVSDSGLHAGSACCLTMVEDSNARPPCFGFWLSNRLPANLDSMFVCLYLELKNWATHST